MTSLLSFWRTPQAELPNNEIRELTAQFYVTLEAYFAKVKSVTPPRCQEAYDRVKDLLEKAPRNWTHAYAIEQLLVHLFDDDTLASELQVRVREAKDTLKPALADYYAAEAAKTPLSAEERRAVLSRLVNDLQWRYTVDEVKRGYTKEITLATGQLFILSLVVFAGSVLLTLAFPQLKQFDLRLVVPALLAGCWGAAFSMLSSLRDRLEASDLDALKVLRARWVLGSRVLIGAGAASVLYFFFVSGLVTGAAFPNLKATTAPTAWLDMFALLVVWCFVAGFSERLIPGLLARTEAKLDTASTPDRYRPAGLSPDAANAASFSPKPSPANSQTAPANAAVAEKTAATG
jgi:hypothetical protein